MSNNNQSSVSVVPGSFPAARANAHSSLFLATPSAIPSAMCPHHSVPFPLTSVSGTKPLVPLPFTAVSGNNPAVDEPALGFGNCSFFLHPNSKPEVVTPNPAAKDPVLGLANGPSFPRSKDKARAVTPSTSPTPAFPTNKIGRDSALPDSVFDVPKVLTINKMCRTNSSSGSLVSSLLKLQQLGKDVQPALLLDGSNFPLWSSALNYIVASVTQKENCFNWDLFEEESATALGVLAVIKHSIDLLLRSSLNGMTAHGAWTSLYDRFSGPSCSDGQLSRSNFVCKSLYHM
ncbi:uncharacterized protein PGTG_05800 [Puccinia graminis f. sp. tritici CRL 75-36-700-3]|uniref:Uncharacterized protein n=1 Tax=Puccinia graminis f. sp. tritici (strain CRL 75-36-700-3 / race SCCL) TaxID=418459 RepID=E3K5M2_PUCGT|nr:uncharacterized protein PGTG_05800 [Puccinia graminis f. sp. tritici CRL 75-36-700-3]EFP79479.1 hypothetical protein PGTG_05800 [Puccinia graminis f. sp. tritici CRL 75-36-700-3]